MTVLRVAAQLIRRAAVDENYALDLWEAAQDETVRTNLIEQPIRENDYPVLAAGEWLWFAQWRQSLGGPLDVALLHHLDRSLLLGSRDSRFRLRGLAMRDVKSEHRASDPHADHSCRWYADRASGRCPRSRSVQ